VGKEAEDEPDGQTNSESSLEYVKLYGSCEGTKEFILSLLQFMCVCVCVCVCVCERERERARECAHARVRIHIGVGLWKEGWQAHKHKVAYLN